MHLNATSTFTAASWRSSERLEKVVHCPDVFGLFRVYPNPSCLTATQISINFLWPFVVRSCVFLGVWKAGVEDDALGTFRPSCSDSSCSEGGCWSGPAVWVGGWMGYGSEVSPVVNDVPLAGRPIWRFDLFDSQQLVDRWAHGGIARHGWGLDWKWMHERWVKREFSSMHVPVVEDVRIAQQKAETKQRALLVIDEPTETPEKPRRRILCRSTHDKTRKDWDASKFVSGKKQRNTCI